MLSRKRDSKPRMPEHTRPTAAARPPTQRSRVTNGKTLFAAGGDMRSPWARRMRDVFEAHTSDLGGVDASSAAELSIARRVAVLTVELERMEAVFAVADATPEALTLYQMTANSLRRMLESLGLKRRPRDVTLSLATYLAARPLAESAGASLDLTAVSDTNAANGHHEPRQGPATSDVQAPRPPEAA
jgi:hypothetical protein